MGKNRCCKNHYLCFYTPVNTVFLYTEYYNFVLYHSYVYFNSWTFLISRITSSNISLSSSKHFIKTSSRSSVIPYLKQGFYGVPRLQCFLKQFYFMLYLHNNEIYFFTFWIFFTEIFLINTSGILQIYNRHLIIFYLLNYGCRIIIFRLISKKIPVYTSSL